jgi:hypothetical protein
VRGVAELAGDPGCSDHTEPGQAGVDLSVPLPAKMLAHHRPEPVDVVVEGSDDRDLAGDNRGVGVLEHRWLSQFLGVQPRA